VSDLEASISTLETALADLRRRRKGAFGHMQRGFSILSVIRRLPSDVLAEIFSHTLSHIPPYESNRRLLNDSPWVLGRVARVWRTTSISMSSLWRNINSNVP
ncbi:hypothetical protein B0H12DRAFT_960109, partial [Mycena haematopus]